MEFIWYIIAGAMSGVLGGMGMGGGTLLIPLLTIFYGVSQHVAQASNLISFIPMAIVALIIHLKNRLIDFKGLAWFIIPGIVACVVGSYIARALKAQILKRFFGAFLLVLSIYQFVCEIVQKNKR